MNSDKIQEIGLDVWSFELVMKQCTKLLEWMHATKVVCVDKEPLVSQSTGLSYIIHCKNCQLLKKSKRGDLKVTAKLF